MQTLGVTLDRHVPPSRRRHVKPPGYIIEGPLLYPTCYRTFSNVLCGTLRRVQILLIKFFSSKIWNLYQHRIGKLNKTFFLSRNDKMDRITVRDRIDLDSFCYMETPRGLFTGAPRVWHTICHAPKISDDPFFRDWLFVAASAVVVACPPNFKGARVERLKGVKFLP